MCLTIKSEPLVSIVLPTYNRATLLGQTINSVLEQTYQNFELIIVDDGSTDNTRSILSKFDDPRVQVNYLPHKGRSHARNFGLNNCKGEYISFIDSDDLYKKQKIEIQVNYMSKHEDVMMSYTSADCFWGTDISKIIHRYEAKESGNIYELIAAYVPITICLPTVMIRSEVFHKIGIFDESLERFEDTDYWRRIAKEYEIHGINEVTCLIRTHVDNSLVNQNINLLISQVREYGNKVLKEDSNLLSNRIPEIVGAFYLHYGLAIASNSSFRLRGMRLYLRGKVLSSVDQCYSDDVFLRDKIKKFFRRCLGIKISKLFLRKY